MRFPNLKPDLFALGWPCNHCFSYWYTLFCFEKWRHFLGHCKKISASWFDLTQWGNVEISHWNNIETSVSARWRGFPELLHLIIEKAFRCLCVHGSWWMNVENITISNKILSSVRVYIRPTHFLGRYLPGGDKSVTALTLKPPWCRHHNFVMPPTIPSWPQGDRILVFSGRSYSVDGNPLNRSLDLLRSQSLESSDTRGRNFAWRIYLCLVGEVIGYWTLKR